jgi:hypothetical protein
VHVAQTLTYMRIANCPVGLVINFNARRLTDGVKRLVMGVTDATESTEDESATRE